MFLKYLVEQKEISPKQALEVAALYNESRPSLLHIIFKENVLEASTVLSLYFKAASEGRSFTDLFKAESGLTQSDLDHLYRKQQLDAKSLNQILIEKNFLSQDKYESLLRGYKESGEGNSDLSNDSATHQSQDVVENKDTVESPSSGMGGISAAALESLMEVQGLDASQLSELQAQVSPTEEDPHTIEEVEAPKEDSASSTSSVSDGNASIYAQEYFDFHNEERQSGLLVMANRYRLKKREKDLHLFHEDLTKILSLVKLSEFKYLENLITPYENAISGIMDNRMEVPDEWDPLVSEMLDLVWKFKSSLKTGEEESVLMSDEEFKKIYISNIKNIMKYLKR